MPRFRPPGQCPVCGEWVGKGAAACDSCGACPRSGWSGQADYDGLDLPDDDFDYDEYVQREFGAGRRRRMALPWWAIVAIVLLVVLVIQALLAGR